MKYKAIILSILAVTTALPAWSGPRTKNEIMQAASSTLIKNRPGMMRSPSKLLPLEIIESNEAYSVVGYEGGSYAIISNDDLLPAVLAYSATPFDGASSNPGFAWWSRAIRKVASEIVASGVPASEITLPDPARFPAEVPQLMSNVWGQMEPFNNFCPLEYDANGKLVGRCVVGCVATSATQVMHYHQYPPQGDGYHIDMQTEDAFGRPIPIKIDFADYKFDWANMLDSYSPGNYTREQADAVAALSYPVGVSFGMIYGTGASGTYSDSAIVSLKKHLRFPEARLLFRREHQEKEWMETIYEEISQNRPVLYSGADKWGTIGGGGHAFVFDGYNADGLVHVNWGWYGRNDGYYEVALLNPRIHSFVDNQDMIIRVAPPEALAGDLVVHRLSGNITKKEIDEAVAKSKEGLIHELDLSGAVLPDNHLPDRAFYGSRLQRIVLPSSLRSIGNGAFGACRLLREVVFPTDNSVRDYFVEDDIVYSADGQEVIAVMPYYHNDKAVLTDFTSLLTFREGVRIVRPFAADGCFRVQGVVIPSSVEKIGMYAFKGCTGLKAVKVQNSVPPTLEARAFATLDAGFTKLLIPAATPETYLRAGEWGKFFDFDNVYEVGTNVVARTVVRKPGEPNPEFTWQIFGDYVTGEPELTCEAGSDAKPGEYPIHVSMGTLKGEDITLTDGILRVLDPASVEEIIASGRPFDVWSVDGRCVLRSARSVESLEKGLYMIEGHKIIVN